MSAPAIMNTFLYFAYGSNLLTHRIHINNPTAVRIGIGKLKGYRLDFNGYSQFWDGCPSTVVPDVEENVWGALWQINTIDLNNLDQQEGVPKIYLPFEPSVITPDGINMTCRCYMLVNQPIKQVTLPLNRRPSKAYLNTILLGAKESKLPSDYCEFLEELPNNGKDGPVMPWLKHLKDKCDNPINEKLDNFK